MSTDKFEKLVSDVCNAAAFFTMEYNEARARGERLSYGVDSKIRPILTAALAMNDDRLGVSEQTRRAEGEQK